MAACYAIRLYFLTVSGRWPCAAHDTPSAFTPLSADTEFKIWYRYDIAQNTEYAY